MAYVTLLNKLAQRRTFADAVQSQSAKKIAPAYVVKWNDVIKYKVRQGRPGAGTWIDTETTYAEYYIILAISRWWKYTTSYGSSTGPGTADSQEYTGPVTNQEHGLRPDLASRFGLCIKMLKMLWPNGPKSMLRQGNEDILMPTDVDLDYMSTGVHQAILDYMANKYPGVDWD